MKTALILSTTLLFACSFGQTEHGHEHGTDAHAGHAEADHAPAAEPVEAPMGPYGAQLEPSAEALRLTLTDAQGAAVTPQGQVKVVLSGTGEEEQRVVLEPAGEAWTGAARATGASGYTAVLSVELEGRTETARMAWGDAVQAHDDHDHGDHGHSH